MVFLQWPTLYPVNDFILITSLCRGMPTRQAWPDMFPSMVFLFLKGLVEKNHEHVHTATSSHVHYDRDGVYSVQCEAGDWEKHYEFVWALDSDIDISKARESMSCPLWTQLKQLPLTEGRCLTVPADGPTDGFWDCWPNLCQHLSTRNPFQAWSCLF